MNALISEGGPGPPPKGPLASPAPRGARGQTANRPACLAPRTKKTTCISRQGPRLVQSLFTQWYSAVQHSPAQSNLRGPFTCMSNVTPPFPTLEISFPISSRLRPTTEVLGGAAAKLVCYCPKVYVQRHFSPEAACAALRCSALI